MNSTVSQTRSFSTVFLIEMWERFGYYGMAALLVLFMIDKLGFTDSHATLTWGAFTALVYAAPSVGGWIGDKILGARRTMVFGALVLSCGYLMLAMPNDQLSYMYASLGVIVVGNGGRSEQHLHVRARHGKGKHVLARAERVVGG